MAARTNVPQCPQYQISIGREDLMDALEPLLASGRLSPPTHPDRFKMEFVVDGKSVLTFFGDRMEVRLGVVERLGDLTRKANGYDEVASLLAEAAECAGLQDWRPGLCQRIADVLGEART